MEIPLKWLNDFVKLDIHPEKIARMLTMAGLEVDEVTTHQLSEGEDFIFEISLTPNLNHCANVVGVARELAAATNSKVIYPKIEVKEKGNEKIESLTSVTVTDFAKCPRYACRLVRNVKIGPSPDWMQKRLEQSGIRPINNIVDVTNYVLLELGHPLHAFDFDKLEGHKIVVKTARDGETITTLDNKTRTLVKDDLLICDESKAVAIAGVMGNLNSEVTDSTCNVLLESAYFHPTTVRKTSKRLGLQTDSSRRFERGADPNGILTALNRAAQLIEEISAGEVCKGIIDVKKQEFHPKQIRCRLNRVNQILGTRLSMSEVESVFQRLDMSYKNEGGNALLVTVPTYRTDITGEIDLIEEVARIFGYDNLSREVAPYRSSTLPQAPIFLFEREIRKRLITEGLQEFITCDLLGPTLLGIVKESVMSEDAYIRVLNPTSIEQSYLRTSLLPGLLQVVKYNFDHQNKSIAGFEVGRIHFKEKDQFREHSVAGIVLSGKSRPEHWDSKPQETDFFDLKGIVENLLYSLDFNKFDFKKSNIKLFHPGRQASIQIDNRNIGMMGEIHPSILRRLDLPQRVYFAEFDLHELISLIQPHKKMEPLSIYPASERDWTITLKDEIPVLKVFEIIDSLQSELLENVTLSDIYRSDKLGKGIFNATFHFVYRDKNKTIENEAVDAEHNRLIVEVESRLGR